MKLRSSCIRRRRYYLLILGDKSLQKRFYLKTFDNTLNNVNNSFSSMTKGFRPTGEHCKLWMETLSVENGFHNNLILLNLTCYKLP